MVCHKITASKFTATISCGTYKDFDLNLKEKINTDAYKCSYTIMYFRFANNTIETLL